MTIVITVAKENVAKEIDLSGKLDEINNGISVVMY